MSQSWFTQSLKDVQILSAQQFSPFPLIQHRERWESISEETVATWLSFASDYVNYTWPALPATHYAAYKHEGNLLAYLNAFFERRSALGALVIAELLENEDRYIDDIINGIFAICEETTWVVPHHNTHIREHGAECLPDAADHEVELASAETGALLAITYYVLQHKLNHYSLRIKQRIEAEIQQRLIDPYLTRDDYWWMGFSGAKHLNNWNPWIHENMLTCFLFMEHETDKRKEGIDKILRSLDLFLAKYPADGCCDEGPMYWDSSGGSLYRCLEMLYLASDGHIDIFSDPLVQNIGQYIYRVHIDHNYFVTFADGDAKVNIGESAYGYGKRIGDPDLMQLGASFPVKQPEVFNWFSIYRILSSLLNEKEKQKVKAEIGTPYIREAWMPVKQVMTAREHEHSASGLYLAVKGGHNDESHNHNDVGNFIVFADGEPIFIDLGTESYRKQTFSVDRYDLWYLQSQFHNLPTVNGVLQKAGEEFRAADVNCNLKHEKAEFKLNIAPAYPEEADLVTWERKCSLQRGQQAHIQIVDQFKLCEPSNNISYHFMTVHTPRQHEPGCIEIEYASGNRVHMRYDDKHLTCHIEEITLQDPRLRTSWGDTVYRVILSEKAPISTAKRTFSVQIVKGD